MQHANAEVVRVRALLEEQLVAAGAVAAGRVVVDEFTLVVRRQLAAEYAVAGIARSVVDANELLGEALWTRRMANANAALGAHCAAHAIDRDAVACDWKLHRWEEEVSRRYWVNAEDPEEEPTQRHFVIKFMPQSAVILSEYAE